MVSEATYKGTRSCRCARTYVLGCLLDAQAIGGAVNDDLIVLHEVKTQNDRTTQLVNDHESCCNIYVLLLGAVSIYVYVPGDLLSPTTVTSPLL